MPEEQFRQIMNQQLSLRRVVLVLDVPSDEGVAPLSDTIYYIVCYVRLYSAAWVRRMLVGHLPEPLELQGQ